jgi:glycogen debranching enzyme
MTEQIRKLPEAEGFLPEHYIEATQSLIEQPLRVLKHDSMFAVLNAYGDIDSTAGPLGLYYHDTRFLSYLGLRVEGLAPLLLSSIILDDNAALLVDLANPDIHETEDTITLAKDTILLSRAKFLYAGTCYERIGLRSFSMSERAFSLELRFDADFRDLFEVRGVRRENRGTRIVDLPSNDTVLFRYAGLDGLTRTTSLRFSPAPPQRAQNRVKWPIVLAPQGRTELLLTVACGFDPPAQRAPARFMAAYKTVRRALHHRSQRAARVRSSNELFNEIVERSRFDIGMLVSETDFGQYPSAGVPWYSTIFGRDGIITALFLLWWDASIAKGVLDVLAATQARATDKFSDAQPGKILHERRTGEMARLGEIPFQMYYGSVDATPLFVLLAGRYYDRTGDLATVTKLWPAISAALAWIDGDGDRDRDGFVEYYRESAKGLVNQGWKDSHDSICHSDGSLVEGPVALCEVQAYVYGAKLAASRLAYALNLDRDAARLAQEANVLQKKFVDAFWQDDLGCYALALDGKKRPCRVLSSNAGHALFTGIANPDHAQRIAKTMLCADMFSGWGVRTLGVNEVRYNPMSYHNGSVWPHDNAIIAAGLARYGFKREAGRIFEGLFRAANYQELLRLPELFCGITRKANRGPTSYPVACSPQAWAAATPFSLLASCIGLDLSYADKCVRMSDPTFPDFLNEVTIDNLHLGDARLSLRLVRHGGDVTVNVSERVGDARVVLEK